MSCIIFKHVHRTHLAFCLQSYEKSRAEQKKCVSFLCRDAVSSPSRWQSYGKTREEQNKLVRFFIPSVIMFAIIKMAKVHYYNIKHSFFTLFFILFEGTSKKNGKKICTFPKNFLPLHPHSKQMHHCFSSSVG